MSSSVFRCSVCFKEYKYQKCYLEHCKSHTGPQDGQYFIQPSYYIQPQHMQSSYNPMVANNFQHQYPEHIQNYPLSSNYFPLSNNYFGLPFQSLQHPFQNTVPAQWQQNYIPNYIPNYWPLEIPSQHQQDNYEDMNMDISQTIQHSSANVDDNVQEEDMDLSNSANENQEQTVDVDKYYEVNSAFKKNIIKYAVPNKKEELIYEALVDEKKNTFKEIIENSLIKFKILKFNFVLVGEYMKIAGEELELCNISHRAKTVLLCFGDNVNDMISRQLEEIYIKMSEFQERDSGWTLIRIIRFEIDINKSSLVRGSSWISTPYKLIKRAACINIENEDNYCFKWALIAALNTLKVTHKQRSSSYNIKDISADIILLENGVEINFSNLIFPMPLKKIKEFEEMNSNISVNVFGYDDDSDEIIGPFYITQEEKSKHVNLLLLENGEEQHYIFIQNISRLLKRQTTNHCRELMFCNTCLQYTHKNINMDRHILECGKVVTKLPSADDNILKFKDQQRQMDVPFVIYADFECILENTEIKVSDKSKLVNKHIPCAFSYYIKCISNDKEDKCRLYTGKDAAEKFVEFLIRDCEDIYNKHIINKKEMDALTPSEIFDFNNTLNCHICNNYLGSDRVRDHCHISGKFRGAAHNKCNLKYQLPKFIPIYFHNYSSYDSHLFVKELRKISNNIKVLPLNKELYISLSIYKIMNDGCNLELRFLDTLRFMSESLESLANNLTDSDFRVIKQHFKTISEFNLVKRKGVFPYDYLNTFEKLNDRKLPVIDEFFSKLNNKECSSEDYEHAVKIWQTFNCKTLQDYMELYLKTDVLLLTDIFENFRKVCKAIYNLDPCQYYTLPGLSWDAMLKHTNIELELLTDIDMYNFFKKAIRGGIVQCSKRYSKANNKYLDDFDKEKPSEFLVYLDANNLYGWAMSEYLPYGGFRWLADEELSLDPKTINDNSYEGYVYEVSLEYPSHLHDSHNDLPFCAENKKINESKYQKLIADFSPKYSYIIHYRVLKQCLENGLVLKKIHRILSFKQSPWLKDYIDLNTKHRANAKNVFEKNFFKLLNNAVYGKTMENVDKRKDVKIVTNWNRINRNQLGAQDWISKSNFHSLSIFSEDMVAIQLNRVKTFYNKPIYLGFSVLELSKWKMYNFHYGYMKPKFKTKLSLNYMDTDSFIYTIQTDDFYADIKPDIQHQFDTSDYPADNIYDIPLLNKKVLGLMKDENCGKIMKEFVGLRSKMYSFSVQKQNDVKKSKGVKRSVLDNYSVTSYRNCLFDKSTVYDSMITFKSKVHQIYSNQINKIVLSYADDKRKIMANNRDTLAWYHFKIEETNPDYELDMLLLEIDKLEEEEG